MQLKDFIEYTVTRFGEAELSYGHGTANARDEAVYLIYGALGIDFSESVDRQTRPLSQQERIELEQLIERRLVDQVPVAYLVKKAWFAGRPFYCDSRALIPRSPIAELIVSDFQPLLQRRPERILDLCSGGGCIGIACALQFPGSEVQLSDLSEDCLTLAQENIVLHGLEPRVSVQQSDLFDTLSGKYDLIVSNPPYVSVAEWSDLPPEFRHEPRMALISADEGLDIPVRILQQAEQYLSPDGLLVLEVGYSADALQQRFSGLPFLWLEFEEGGEGVLALTARQLAQYSALLNKPHN